MVPLGWWNGASTIALGGIPTGRSFIARLVACGTRKIKRLTDALTVNPDEPGQQRVPADSENRVAPMRIDLEKGHEHERAAMHLRMRQNEPTPRAPPRRPAEAPAAMIEDVDVERTRPPMSAQAPASQPLDALDEPQQHRGCRVGFCKQHGIEVGWLPAWPQWHCRVDARGCEQLQTRADKLTASAAQRLARRAPRTRAVRSQGQKQPIHASLSRLTYSRSHHYAKRAHDFVVQIPTVGYPLH